MIAASSSWVFNLILFTTTITWSLVILQFLWSCKS